MDSIRYKYLKYKSKYLNEIRRGGSNMNNQYHLIIQPYISGQNSIGEEFGYYYSDHDTREDRDQFNLESLENSNNNFKKACAEIAWVWLVVCQKAIFREIGNFQYLLDLEYGKDLCTLNSITKLDNGKIDFTFSGNKPNSITESFLSSLVEEVRSGGDTWDCGDFGDINYLVAEKNGFLAEWTGILYKYGIEDIQIRVSLNDFDVKII